MTFIYPYILWLLLLYPFFIIIESILSLFRHRRFKRLGNSSFIREHLTNESFWLIKIKTVSYYFGFGFLILTLGRPIIPYGEQIMEKRGIDLVFTLDVSPSMLAQDISQDRLSRAKQEIISLLRRIPQNRVALVIFSGTPFVQVPLTFDHDMLAAALDSVSPESIFNKGTDLTAALETAAGLFTQEPMTKTILLLTDGEDHESGLERVLGDLEKKKISVYTIGIGSSGGGPIPIYADGRIVDYKKDKSGNVIVSKLNGDVLTTIAQRSHGAYFLGDQSHFNLQDIYKAIESLEKKKSKVKTRTLSIELYQYFLLPAILFMLIGYFLPVTRRFWKIKGIL